ncbi:MAG: succinylglutamate-semialdehyde dehydrogenase [Planctomycetaceae bacterium]|nr:succinylglutamate-semialdehyde dehydrogenase [Planctomycetaceae bacterium]
MSAWDQFSATAQNSGRTIEGSNWIAGQWQFGTGIGTDKVASGFHQTWESTSPCLRQIVWRGTAASANQVDVAVEAARAAWPMWQRTSLEERIACVKTFQAIVQQHAGELALLISRETGKALWEGKAEAATVAGKVDLSISALQTRRDTHGDLHGTERVVTRFKSHGVLAVLGPFNFPAHLPNGHIVPAILAGNTVVFKPSELTPAVGQWMVAAWEKAGIPSGVINLVHGGRETGAALIQHPQLDGLLFTGSSNAGKYFHQQFAAQPQKILALEMGGNNPLVVSQVSDLDATVYQILLSAYITSGQRCTCARRLIVVEDHQTTELLARLARRAAALSVGWYDQQPEPFMGSLISPQAGRLVFDFWQQLLAAGGTTILAPHMLDNQPALVTPGLIEMTNATGAPDEECFGPVLQVYRVPSLAAAIDLANRTKYGLSAGLLTQRLSDWDEFIATIRAGVVNLNRQTTGASGKLAFGGCGLSGNHRPSGYYAADYCSFPVASMESDLLQVPDSKMPGMNW